MDYPEIDFETYSEAGYEFVDGKWKSLVKHKSGIQVVGEAAYTEHSSATILCLAYDFHRGNGEQLWTPFLPSPHDLFNYVLAGGILEAHKSIFEFYAWNNIGVKKYGFPPLPYTQLRCSMAKALVFGLPGALEKATDALGLIEKKDKKGKVLLRKLSIPHNNKKPTFQDYDDLYKYCAQDIRAEHALSKACPDMTDRETQIYLLDQKINIRGVKIDTVGLDDCIFVLKQAESRYTEELKDITDGSISSVGEVKKITEWLASEGVFPSSLDEAAVTEVLKTAEGKAKRVLEIRQMLGSNSVKKLYSIKNMLYSNGRLHGLFQYYGAERTGRFAGRGPQPQNLPAKGPKSIFCKRCGKYSGFVGPWCPRCGTMDAAHYDTVEWCPEAAEQALSDMSYRNLDYIERIWGNALTVISGCIRSLFVAEEGSDLLCSDFSAIEAVVIAMLSGEQWRIDVFRTHRKIYEMCMSKITGIPFEEILKYKETHGTHHPLRKQFGKIPELASCYQGWEGAWIRFGADKYMSHDEIIDALIKWRADSPMICGIKEYGRVVQHGIWSGLEEACRFAIMNPGTCYSYRDITYGVKNNVLYCKLPSGRSLCYQSPGIDPYTNSIYYWGWNSNYLAGPIGWVRIETYGGKLTENVVQAVARDIQCDAMLRVENAGYPIVLHVHDEIAAEIRKGYGSVEHIEALMSEKSWWFKDWPILASGGWRGKRFRKD